MFDLTPLLRELVPLYDHMDLRVEMPGDGTFRVHVPFRPEVKGHIGTVHAAFQWAAAELLGGLTTLATFGSLDDIFLVVREVNIRFVGPARSDLVAEASFPDDRATALRDAVSETGESSFELAMTVKDAAGEVVAEATGDYLVRRRRER